MTSHVRTMTAEEREQARTELEQRNREWLASLSRCTCPRPVPDRVYLGWVQCRICEKLTGMRSRRRG